MAMKDERGSGLPFIMGGMPSRSTWMWTGRPHVLATKATKHAPSAWGRCTVLSAQ
jgi:hypothetical protein